jgi:predicted RNase H-like HicB family nuclease
MKNKNLMKLTAVIIETLDKMYIGKIIEFPEVLTQGETIEETKENLLDALHLYLEDVKADFEASKEPFTSKYEVAI